MSEEMITHTQTPAAPNSTEEEMDAVRVQCRKCFLEEIDPAAYERDIKRLLLLMEPSEKASEGKYQARLSVCRACGYLNQATCDACGCYVELRAAKQDGRCPYHRWQG
jgi:hypothetical protein